MQRRDWSFFVAVVSTALLFASASEAQQLKPYFLVIFDTSGSMMWCAGGSESQFGANDCSCLNNSGGPCFGANSNPADSAFRSNRCGFPSNRIGDAKCALQRIVDATSGDAVFGLMQFEHPCSGNCTNTVVGNAGNACNSMQGAAYDDGQLVVGIANNNTTLMREWVDGTGSCQGTCTNNFTHELIAGVWTPITRSLQRANQYLRGQPQAGFLYPTNPSGFNAAPPAPLANDPQLACRPVSVILLTDGKDTCTANPTADPPAAAEALMGGGNIYSGNPANKAFRTYVIGFGGSGDSYDPATLGNIAMRGGTNQFYSASNEAQLSAVLNQIIADAQPPMEVCNGMDDDCDGNFDEGIQKFCDLSRNITAQTLCEEPNETKCDGIDDDCDGILDEGLTNVCGTCGDVPKEMCDGVDNDCDLRIDEEASTLDTCGNDTGECEAGRLVCVEGTERCEGQRGPTDEICDCKDNDCDGNIDEEGGGEPLCPGELRCAGCQCQPYCKPVQEFGNVCEAGRAADVQPNGECICVVDKCDSEQCAKQTIQQGGDVVCAPNDPKAGNCVCSAGECVSRCVGVTCGDGTVCSPRNGQCVENTCRGLGCDSGELCDPMSGRCVEDKCADVTCGDGELCRAGTCEKSCGSVKCDAGESCKRGVCSEDKCASVRCAAGETCDPDSGECIADPCESLSCPRGQVCSISTGMCGADPCWDIDCPSGESCRGGECISRAVEEPSTPNTPPPGAPSKGNRLFATGGGGGCACSAPGPSGPSSQTNGAWLLIAVGLWWIGARSRRRREESSNLSFFLVVGLACLPLLAACKVSPVCLDAKCGGEAVKPEPRDAGEPDTGFNPPNPDLDAGADGGDVADAEADSSTPTNDGGLPMCTPSMGGETCNGKDDDCDFRADEGVVAPANNCLQRGVCAGATPACASGKFVCRYNTTDFEMDETRCDGKDNDCDGKVDESFAQLGSSCEVGVGACKVAGTRRCNAAGTGLQCDVPSPKAPGEEVCNGVDDDCDGMIDEPKATPGMSPSYVRDEFVKIGESVWVYKYEASRADATPTARGLLSQRACSRPNALPWTDLTFAQAVGACEASGLSLCSVDDWVTACKGGAGSCQWSYTSDSGCDDYLNDGSNACNGHNIDAQPGSPDSDVLKPTGSMDECYADFGSAGQVFDLSGNAKEMTRGPQSPDQNPLRGGSYNNAPMGLQCDFDFSVGGRDLHLPNVGFRCCTSVAP